MGIATADLYPRVTLSAGIAAEGLLSGPTAAAWSFVGGIAAPIFHGGALSARKRAAQDDYQAALGDYQQTVLAAFQQIADNLHGLANAADAVRTEQKALDSANAALRLTRLGYGIGNAGIIQVIDAQRLSQFEQRYHGGITPASFEAAQILLAEARPIGDFLLCQALFATQTREVSAHEYPHIHRVADRNLHILSLDLKTPSLF